jgi:hypothetical protein
MQEFLSWLAQDAVGPALFGLPVTAGAADLAETAQRWFRRLRRSDGLSRIVIATGDDARLSRAEFAAVRRLLEQDETWVLAGRGTVESLAGYIASCLVDREAGRALAAGRAIAAGVLDFTIRDLEPEYFQQVLFARLERMQTDQASVLEQAMVTMHTDLAAFFAVKDRVDAGRFWDLTSRLAQLLDRLPPGSADRDEVAVYLATLIQWLNTDPWPQDARFGPVLTPAAIEQKLRVATSGGNNEHNLDADEIAGRCARLVILGSPGTGKTWLARRAARLCAEAALRKLAEGACLDDVELPLYTTCARLSVMPPAEGIRRAIISSTLGQLPDLGGSRVTTAVQMLFEDRNAPTLLVLDSLDEAFGVDDRIRQADSLPDAWRIVLTSRPASWNGQLAIGDRDPSHKVVTLEPLRYPNDVDPFIEQWYAAKPQHVAGLTAQLRDRPELQQAATVPLILTFYCMLGGDEELPGRRFELCAKVIRRLLTGRWRTGGKPDLDQDECLSILRNWAWSAAGSNPVSGVGAWTDEFPTSCVRLSQDVRNALDHVAVQLGAADIDSGITQRRFIHRSVHEHLVAEYVIRTSAEEAAAELLNHLWYDPDWEYAAPAALARHPQRDQLLNNLIGLVTGRDEACADLASIDGCWEIRRFLARAAAESREADWSPDACALISKARMDLATSWHESIRLVETGDWPSSTAMIIQVLLEQLESQPSPNFAHSVANTLTQLNPAAQDRERARTALCRLIADDRYSDIAPKLAYTFEMLGPTPGEQAQARGALIAKLPSRGSYSSTSELAAAIAMLGPAAGERAEARAALVRTLAFPSFADSLEIILFPGHARLLTEAIAWFVVTEEDRAQVRESILGLLCNEACRLAFPELYEAVIWLNPTSEDRQRAQAALLTWLTGGPEFARSDWLNTMLAELKLTADHRAQVLAALLKLSADETRDDLPSQLAGIATMLAVTKQERASARARLLALLAVKPNSPASTHLARAAAGLATTENERAGVRSALLNLLTRVTDGQSTLDLTQVIAGLEPSAEERARARMALFSSFTETTNWRSRHLAETVRALAVTEGEQAQMRTTLLTALVQERSPLAVPELVKALAGLDPAPEELARARRQVQSRLTEEIEPAFIPCLADAVLSLDPSADERELAQGRGREALLIQLAVEKNVFGVPYLMEEIAPFAVTEQQREEVRVVLLRKLAETANSRITEELAEAITHLAVTEDERAQTRAVLFKVLREATEGFTSWKLAQAIALLGLTIADLSRSGRWPRQVAWELFPLARQNSAVSSWLAALPQLSIAPNN